MELVKLNYAPVRNSKGDEIHLTPREQYHADLTQRKLNEMHANSLGYEIPITTLTAVIKSVSEQKFFEISPAEYVPIVVGQNAWSTSLTTFRSFDLNDQFETGLINTGGQNSRLASADVGVDTLNIKVYNWAKSIGWSIMDLEFAAKSGNWDLVVSKERARKRNWDLGIQRIAFLGARSQNGVGGSCLGLMNQAGVTINTTIITKPISSMNVTELKTFTATIIEAYRQGNNRTAWPTHFFMPESDYNGTAGMASADFPIKSVLELLEGAFKTVTRNPNFKILPLAYGDAAYHADIPSIAGKQVYLLINYNSESLRMDVPVDYTPTLANSVDNFSFQNAAYGQFTGVLAYRPLEMMYFQY